MYEETLSDVESAAASKANLVDRNLPAAVVHSAMAGAYVGLGIVLIFALGTPLDRAGSPFTGLIMAATFGVALSLVLAAGSDLFTGDTMIMTVGALRGASDWTSLAKVWGWSWLGNLAGSALVAGLAAGAGIFATDPSLVVDVAALKMNAPGDVLFLRGILCNWLVVLAVWSWFKMDNEIARLIMVWWCLLAFIGSGYEHSVANMTLLTMANVLPHGPEVSLSGMAHNLLYVSLGNVVSGTLLMGGAYWLVTDRHRAATETPTPEAAPGTVNADD